MVKRLFSVGLTASVLFTLTGCSKENFINVMPTADGITSASSIPSTLSEVTNGNQQFTVVKGLNNLSFCFVLNKSNYDGVDHYILSYKRQTSVSSTDMTSWNTVDRSRWRQLRDVTTTTQMTVAACLVGNQMSVFLIDNQNKVICNTQTTLASSQSNDAWGGWQTVSSGTAYTAIPPLKACAWGSSNTRIFHIDGSSQSKLRFHQKKISGAWATNLYTNCPVNVINFDIYMESNFFMAAATSDLKVYLLNPSGIFSQIASSFPLSGDFRMLNPITIFAAKTDGIYEIRKIGTIWNPPFKLPQNGNPAWFAVGANSAYIYLTYYYPTTKRVNICMRGLSAASSTWLTINNSNGALIPCAYTGGSQTKVRIFSYHYPADNSLAFFAALNTYGIGNPTGWNTFFDLWQIHNGNLTGYWANLGGLYVSPPQ